MHRIDFIKPCVHRGLNYTVRRGPKWFERLQIGDCVNLGQTDGDVFEQAVVTEILNCELSALPQRVYNFEHDPSCRDLLGLRSAMIRAYQDLQNVVCLGAENITVIGFVPLGCGIPQLADLTNRPARREQVYQILDGEVEYAMSLWDAGQKENSWPDKEKPVECWLVWMDTYISEAKKAATRSANKMVALDNIRKAAGLAVSCMTYHPVRTRAEENAEKEKKRG